jgi:F0F1-type ATP synthase assembly protein I
MKQSKYVVSPVFIVVLAVVGLYAGAIIIVLAMKGLL